MVTRNPALYNQLIWELYPHYLQGLGYIPGGAGFLPSTVWQHDLEKIWKQDVLIKTVYSLHLALWSEMSKLSVVSNLQYLSQAIIPTNELCVCHIVNLGNQGLCIKRIRAHRNYEDLWGCIHSQDRKNRQRSNEMVTLLDAWPVLRPISEPTSHIVGLPGTLPGRLPEWVPGTRSCPRLAVLQQILGKASHLDHMMAALCCFCLTAWLLDVGFLQPNTGVSSLHQCFVCCHTWSQIESVWYRHYNHYFLSVSWTSFHAQQILQKFS